MNISISTTTLIAHCSVLTSQRTQQLQERITLPLVRSRTRPVPQTQTWSGIQPNGSKKVRLMRNIHRLSQHIPYIILMFRVVLALFSLILIAIAVIVRVVVRVVAIIYVFPL